MIKEFHFTGKELKEMGWDGNPNTLEDFKKEIRSWLETGWDPNKMSLQEYIKWWNNLPELIASYVIRHKDDDIEEDDDIINDEEEEYEDDDDDDEDNLQERRRRAEQLGWDEEEMDLEEFEDYYM